MHEHTPRRRHGTPGAHALPAPFRELHVGSSGILLFETLSGSKTETWDVSHSPDTSGVTLVTGQVVHPGPGRSESATGRRFDWADSVPQENKCPQGSHALRAAYGNLSLLGKHPRHVGEVCTTSRKELRSSHS